jgi:gas vesicle protein
MINNLVKLCGYALLTRELADYICSSRQAQEKELKRSNVIHAASGAMLGMTIGAGLGILFAPRPGKETREIISCSASEQFQNLQNQLAEKKKQLGEMLSQGKEKLCSATEDPTGEEAELTSLKKIRHS